MPDASSNALPRSAASTSAFQPVRDLAAEMEAGLEREMRMASGQTLHPQAWPSVSISLHRDLSELEPLWRAFETRASCTGFQTFDWLKSAQASVGIKRGEQPLVILGRNAQGEVLFLFPFAIGSRGAAKRLTWLTAEMCDYNAPLLGPGFPETMPPEQFAALWSEILGFIRGQTDLAFDVTDLTKMPERVGQHANPFRSLAVYPNPSGAHIATLGTDWDSFYAQRRSKPTRQREKRQLKKLGEFGDVRFSEVTDPAEIALVMDTLYEQKARSFARMGVENIFDRPGYKEFFSSVAPNAKLQGLVKISRYDIGSVIAATNLGIQFQNHYYNVLTSYHDGDMSRFGPGRFHLHELLTKAMADGCIKFDMTIGDEGYKRTWADIQLTLYDHLEAQTARGWVVVQYYVWLRKLKRFIKQTPAVWRAFTYVRALKSKLTGAGKPPSDSE